MQAGGGDKKDECSLHRSLAVKEYRLQAKRNYAVYGFTMG